MNKKKVNQKTKSKKVKDSKKKSMRWRSTPKKTFFSVGIFFWGL